MGSFATWESAFSSFSCTLRTSVGCVRNDYGMPEQVQFWSVADNVRFGGALMAVKIAEKLVQEYLY